MDCLSQSMMMVRYCHVSTQPEDVNTAFRPKFLFAEVSHIQVIFKSRLAYDIFSPLACPPEFTLVCASLHGLPLFGLSLSQLLQQRTQPEATFSTRRRPSPPPPPSPRPSLPYPTHAYQHLYATSLERFSSLLFAFAAFGKAQKKLEAQALSTLPAATNFKTCLKGEQPIFRHCSE